MQPKSDTVKSSLAYLASWLDDIDEGKDRIEEADTADHGRLPQATPLVHHVREVGKPQ